MPSQTPARTDQWTLGTTSDVFKKCSHNKQSSKLFPKPTSHDRQHGSSHVQDSLPMGLLVMGSGSQVPHGCSSHS